MAQTILISSRSFGRFDPAPVAALREAGHTLIECREGAQVDHERMRNALREATVWVVSFYPIDAELLDGAPNLKLIIKHGVGLDNIDLDGTARRGITVTTAPGATEHAVPEHTLALLLALARHIKPAANAVDAGRWERHVGIGLHGRTLGIVGLGRIGANLACKASGLGMRMIGCDPFVEALPDVSGFEVVEQAQVLSEADCVCLCAPLTDETRGLIGDATLKVMKPGVLIINTARGELVDEHALAEAIKRGHVGGYATDVFAQEPPTDSPLMGLDNVLGTPHIASQADTSLRLMGQRVVDAVAAHDQGKLPDFTVKQGVSGASAGA